MKYIIRRTGAVVILLAIAQWIAIAEPHRQILAAVWPLFTDFWFTYIAF